MRLPAFLLAVLLATAAMPACVVVKIESPAGSRLQPQLIRGMTRGAAMQVLGKGGVIIAETEYRFTAGRRPLLMRSKGEPAPPPDLHVLPEAERARVAAALVLTRYYGILGLDNFTLLLDANDRLLSSQIEPLQ